MLNKIKRLARSVYLKLFRINDTPLKIALGFGLGAFTGVMPGIGPIVALVLALVFRVNRASALLGSVLFNTWVSVVALVLAVRVGAAAMGLNDHDVYAAWVKIFQAFTWEKLFAASVHDVLVPIAVGYAIVSLGIALAAAIVVYAVALWTRRKVQRSD